MKSNIFIFTIFTISSLALFGCDQIVDRSMGKISETKNNESTLTNKGSSLKSLDNSPKDNIMKKREQQTKLTEEDLSKDNNKELKKRLLPLMIERVRLRVVVVKETMRRYGFVFFSFPFFFLILDEFKLKEKNWLLKSI